MRGFGVFGFFLLWGGAQSSRAGAGSDPWPGQPRSYLAVVAGARVEVHGGQEIGLLDARVPVGAGHVGDLLPRGWGHKSELKLKFKK